MRTAPATPVPQANRIDVLASVVDAVAEGADTSALIAAAIGYDPSQGWFYSNAAITLGWLEKDYDGLLLLTGSGYEFCVDDAEARMQDACARFSDNADVQALTEDPTGDTLRARWTHLADTTIERRLSTILAWVAFLQKPAAERTRLVDIACTAARDNAPRVVEEHRRAQVAKALRAAPHTVHNPGPSGQCGVCGTIVCFTKGRWAHAA